MAKIPKPVAAPKTDAPEIQTPKIELSEEFRKLEKIFLKSIVENPKTPIEVFAALSPWNLLRVVQDADAGLSTRRHNPALAAYLKEALQKEDFPANVLGLLLSKDAQSEYFKKLQNFALEHIEKFPGKAEAALDAAAKRKPERFEHNPEGLKKKRQTKDKPQSHYALVDVKVYGEPVGSMQIPTASTIKGARDLAFVQFWNDFAADNLGAAGSFRPVATLSPFRHKTPLKLGTYTPKFNEGAQFDLLGLAAEKGYTLNYEQGKNVEILGQEGVTATFTLAGKYSKNRPFEFTVTRFGADVKTADSLAAMSLLAQYHNTSPEPKQ